MSDEITPPSFDDILGRTDWFDEFDYENGLDGVPLKTGESHIQANGQPGITPVGVPVSGPIWVEPASGGMRPASASLDELSAYQHKYYSVDFRAGQDSGDPDQPVSHQQAELDQAHTWSSELVDANGERTGYHTVMIDVDHPVRVLPSSTPGHYHLYIDVPVGEVEYFELLEKLVEVGVIEQGYYEASRARSGTHLRLPWVKKDTPLSEQEDDAPGRQGILHAIPAELDRALREGKVDPNVVFGRPQETDLFDVDTSLIDPEDLVDRADRESDDGGEVSYRGHLSSEALILHPGPPATPEDLEEAKANVRLARARQAELPCGDHHHVNQYDVETCQKLQQDKLAHERLEQARSLITRHSADHLEWDVEHYEVAYVDGKGVLRRRRNVKSQDPQA